MKKHPNRIERKYELIDTLSRQMLSLQKRWALLQRRKTRVQNFIAPWAGK